jgi:hypothetical protein
VRCIEDITSRTCLRSPSSLRLDAARPERTWPDHGVEGFVMLPSFALRRLLSAVSRSGREAPTSRSASCGPTRIDLIAGRPNIGYSSRLRPSASGNVHRRCVAIPPRLALRARRRMPGELSIAWARSLTSSQSWTTGGRARAAGIGELFVLNRDVVRKKRFGRSGQAGRTRWDLGFRPTPKMDGRPWRSRRQPSVQETS